jgi:CubicO group peptidase (beta-lactamase class C family)
MLAGRDPKNVLDKDLSWFPISLGSFAVNYEDSSATGSVLGLARRKAIFRKGLGCSLLVEMEEDEFRNQKFSLATKPAVNQDSVLWPNGNLNADTVITEMDRALLGHTLDKAFSEPGPDSLRKTRAVVVVYKGKIIAERYAPGFDQHTKLIGWSMNKSVTNALVGILVKKGKLTLDAPAKVAGWDSDDRKNITLNHLMHASSGLDWEENYGGTHGTNSMLFNKKDMGVYAAEAKAIHPPDEVFYYSSGTTNIISRIIRQTVGDEGYYRFPYEELLFKIGMLNTTLETDAGGTFVGSSYSFGPARDWARFGLLYLNDGVWNGERILPEGWVKYTTTPAKAAERGKYGAQWWLNAGDPSNPKNRVFPDVPADLFWAEGFEGQNVFVIPSKELVVAKLGLTKGDDVDDNAFLATIIKAVEGFDN